MKSRFTIGSRGSRLALCQADWVRTALKTKHPNLDFDIQIIKTSGDVMKDASLSVIGGKGVFTKELEDALLDGRIDLAAHSLKDLPTMLPEKLCIAAITEREDPRDALVLRLGIGFTASSLAELPDDAVVGTSSPRRTAQLKHLSPARVVKDLRGNVDTRLRKLDEGQYDALVLAAAGLRRLELTSRINAYIDPSEMLPAVGQGALGIETRADDAETRWIVETLNHYETHAACTAERAMLRALGGGCQLPIAGHASVESERIRIEGLVSSVDGVHLIRDSIEGLAKDADSLGQTLGERLLAMGSGSLLC